RQITPCARGASNFLTNCQESGRDDLSRRPGASRAALREACETPVGVVVWPALETDGQANGAGLRLGARGLAVFHAVDEALEVLVAQGGGQQFAASGAASGEIRVAAA